MTPATATARKCPDCGEPEYRGTDARGRELVNLDPITDRCITCLVKRALANRSPRVRPLLPFDPRAAAARNDA